MADEIMKEKKEPLAPLAVSTTEAARLLGITRPTLYTLINRSDFPAFHVGSRVLISVEGLKQWVEEQAGTRAAL